MVIKICENNEFFVVVMLQTIVIVGGLASQKQERLLRGRPDIVIATPGRLWELVQDGGNYLSTLSKIKYVLLFIFLRNECLWNNINEIIMKDRWFCSTDT